MINTYKRAQYFMPAYATADDRKIRSMSISAKLERINRSGMGFKARLAAMQAVSTKHAISIKYVL